MLPYFPPTVSHFRMFVNISGTSSFNLFFTSGHFALVFQNSASPLDPFCLEIEIFQDSFHPPFSLGWVPFSQLPQHNLMTTIKALILWCCVHLSLGCLRARTAFYLSLYPPRLDLQLAQGSLCA